MATIVARKMSYDWGTYAIDAGKKNAFAREMCK
jgi:hypothetical protein